LTFRGLRLPEKSWWIFKEQILLAC